MTFIKVKVDGKERYIARQDIKEKEPALIEANEEDKKARLEAERLKAEAEKKLDEKANKTIKEQKDLLAKYGLTYTFTTNGQMDKQNVDDKISGEITDKD